MRRMRCVKGFVFVVITTVLIQCQSFAQYCDSITPSFNVDLSAAPYMTWVSPSVQRDGFCCGASSPDKCLEFIITLNPNSAAIVFNIASGAVPPGALFYQIDCGPPTPVGSPICLSGVGPFHLTFCKPGNNTNSFSIETIPNPIFGPNISLGDGCSGLLGVQFYDEASVTWNSINPGAAGTYNGLLSCSTGCDTTTVTNTGGLPAQIDYLVCGTALNGCVFEPVCDTLSVTLTPSLTVTINAPDTVLCSNETFVPVNAVVSGGTPPYSISWSNGATTTSTAIGVGTSTVTVTDANGCSATTDNVTVTQLPPLTVNAGGNINQCADYIGAITLNGTSNASDVVWSGGNGTFFPSNMVPNPDYTPTPGEIQSGDINLTLTTNDSSGCPNASDNMNIIFNETTQSVSIQTTNVTCNGNANGTVTVTAVGPQAPFTYSFDGGAYSSTNTASGLGAGNHTVSIQSSLGCDSTISFVITEPPVLVASEVSHENILCFGGNNGSVTSQTVGGTTPYNYSWNTTPVQTSANVSNLTAGTYTLTVTDANGCTAQFATTITQPTALGLTFNTVEPSCYGLANGAVSANVTGGSTPYSYSWNTGSSATSIYSVAAGTYSLTISDSNGCVISATEIVGQPPQLLLSTNADTIICPGSPQTLAANASGGTGTYTYAWTPIGGNQSTATVSPMVNTTYTCTVQDNNGCSISSSTVINVFTLNPNDIHASASEDSVCINDPVNLFGQYSGNDNTVVLTWNFCPACPANTSDNPGQTTTYTITGTNQCNQTISASVPVVVVPPPSIALAPTQASICQNEYFSVHSTAITDTTWHYFWDFGDGGTSHDMVGIHSYANPGTYTITCYVVNAFGCTSDSTASTTITVNPQADAFFTPSSFVETTLDPVFTFFNQSSNADSYVWNFGDGSSSTNVSPTHAYQDYGSFNVILNANNVFNCPSQYMATVEVKPSFDIYVPNAFTPDGDSHNQVFIVQGFGISDKNFELLVFNRWGEIVFETHDINVGWDGTYKSEQSQDGVYTWVVRFRDLTDSPHEKTGHVSLLR